jgi:ATP-dependent DNA helicase RecG
LSAAELLNVVGLKSKTGAFKRMIRDLLNQKLIEYTLPDKPKSRFQQYRITVKGRDALIAEFKDPEKGNKK